MKRGDAVPLSVSIQSCFSASGLLVGIKAKGNYEGDLLILAEADSGTQTEQGTRFDLKLMAYSLVLNEALDVWEDRLTSGDFSVQGLFWVWQKAAALH